MADQFKACLDRALAEDTHTRPASLSVSKPISQQQTVRLILTTSSQKKTVATAQQDKEQSRELSSMKKEFVIEMPIETARESSYLNALLQNDRAVSQHEWKAAEGLQIPAEEQQDGAPSNEADVMVAADTVSTSTKVIRLALSKNSAVSLEALVMCLEFLASKNTSAIQIDQQNQFQLLAAASMLKLQDVTETCVNFVATNITTASAVVASKFAVHINSSVLLKACYYFFKSQAVIQVKHSLTESIKLDILSSKAKKQAAKPKVELVFDDQGSIHYGQNSIGASVFADLTQVEHKAKVLLNRAMFTYDLYYVEEANVGSGSFPRTYHMYHDGKNEFVMMAYQQDEFSDFIISSNPNFKPEQPCVDDSFLGIVTSNFIGTEFHVYDWGVNPQLLPPVFTATTHPSFIPRRQLCHIVFDRNVMGSQPRALKVRLPDREILPDPLPQDAASSSTSPQDDLGDGILPSRFLEFINKPPFWNEENECWMLDFFGRVNLASAKNFQLITQENSDDVYLMFGKMTETRYSLDFRHPLSKLQAFGIGLAGIARKLAVN
eukprot:c11088_g1_i1.p1 GENE.c11088_g1_i1~~c11088_g1_i1.p1  ORF type:complete len:550 (-),score=89.75 c11088_g1_i1:990-2639(-)